MPQPARLCKMDKHGWFWGALKRGGPRKVAERVADDKDKAKPKNDPAHQADQRSHSASQCSSYAFTSGVEIP